MGALRFLRTIKTSVTGHMRVQHFATQPALNGSCGTNSIAKSLSVDTSPLVYIIISPNLNLKSKRLSKRF